MKRTTLPRRGPAPRLTPYSYRPVSSEPPATGQPGWHITKGADVVALLIGPEWVALDCAIALNRRERAAGHIKASRIRRSMGAL